MTENDRLRVMKELHAAYEDTADGKPRADIRGHLVAAAQLLGDAPEMEAAAGSLERALRNLDEKRDSLLRLSIRAVMREMEAAR